MFLTLEQISVCYPQALLPAVNFVSLQLVRGQIGALVGPSGSGKTTLLRVIAGLEQAQQGQICLDGAVLVGPHTHVSVEKRRIGMVFQDFALFPHLTVGANIGFGLSHLSTRQRARRVEEILALVGLAGRQTHYPHQLSGGQQQRVALGRALAPAPRLLLLDEPFSSLDSALRERLAQEIREILKQTDSTALMVTHDQPEAFAMADIVGVMQDGYLQQWSSPYDVYHRPATRFVAEFVGHGVLLPGRVCTEGVRTACGMLEEHGAALSLQSGQRVDVLLRPEALVYDAEASCQARVVCKMFRGAAFLYTLELKNGQQLLALLSSCHSVGEWIGILPRVRHLAVFPCPKE